jgi:hypothetical protein
MADQPNGIAERRAKIRKLLRFGALVWATIACGLVLFWVFGGFRNMGLSAAGAVALMIGILGTCTLGIALMALLFYSDQSNADEAAYHFKIAPQPPDQDEPTS